MDGNYVRDRSSMKDVAAESLSIGGDGGGAEGIFFPPFILSFRWNFFAVAPRAWCDIRRSP